MIKRPLDQRFGAAVCECRKVTTIRDNEWPMSVPIMLYHWSGAPYRSKHVDVAAVMVTGVWSIRIAHLPGGVMRYAYDMDSAEPLYETEGFGSKEEMDDWFRPLVPVGQVIDKKLMRFYFLCSASNNHTYTHD